MHDKLQQVACSDGMGPRVRAGDVWFQTAVMATAVHIQLRHDVDLCCFSLSGDKLLCRLMST